MVEVVDGYRLRPEVGRQVVAQLTQRTTRLLESDAAVIEKHNGYTLFVVSLLLWATGHRPVRDPFCYHNEISLRLALMVVADKVMQLDRAYRLVPLAPIAVEQLSLYFDHLASLTNKFLAIGGPFLRSAKAIQILLTGQKCHTPLFFLLHSDGSTRSITAGEIKSFWEDLHIPKNYGRKFLASELPNYGVCASDLMALLGHDIGLEHQFGKNSEIAPVAVMNRLKSAIEHLMRDYGWRALSGLKFYCKTVGKPAKKAEPAPHEQAVLGPEARGHERDRRRNLVRELIERSAIALGLADTKAISLEQGYKLIQEVKRHAVQSDVNLPFERELSLWFVRRSRKGVNVANLPLTFLLKSEPSPFSSRTINGYEKATRVRDNLLLSMAKVHKGNELADPANRCALVVASAALLGAVSNVNALKAIGSISNSDLYFTNGVLHLELFEPREQDRHWIGRWMPASCFEAATLIGSRILEKRDVPYKRQQQALSELLQRLGLVGGKDAYLALANLATVLLTMESPGCLRGSGRIPTGSLPLPEMAWCRLLTGKIPPTDGVGEGEPREPVKKCWVPIIPSQPSAHQYAKGAFREIKRLLQERFNAIEIKWENAEFGKSRKRANRLLADNLKELVEGSDDCPPLARLIIGWTYNLCIHGTPRKPNPATSTIEKYAFLVFNALKDVERESIDFLELDAEAYEFIYSRAIDRGKQKYKRALLSQLSEFHQYLVNEYSVEQLNWGPIWAAAGIRAPSVSVNFISDVEYFRALDVIQADGEIPALRKLQYSVMMILGYRFGLRFGEARRLQPRQIQNNLDWSMAYVIVRNLVYGWAKSVAASRQVPLLEKLSSREVELLNQLINHAENHDNGDHQIGLMAINPGHRRLIDRGEASTYINRVLKDVTGSELVHYHHFRDTYVSRVIAAIAVPEDVEGDQSHSGVWNARGVNLTPLSMEGTFPAPLRALSVVMGHADLWTTLYSYSHMQKIAKEYHWASAEALLPDAAWAGLLGEEYSTLKRRKARAQDPSGFDPFAHAIRRLKLNDFAEGYREYSGVESRFRGAQDREQVSPAHVLQLLLLLNRRRGLGGISEASMMAEPTIRRIIDIAGRVERDTGIIDFGVFRHGTYVLNRQNREYLLRENLLERRRLANVLLEKEPLLLGLDDTQRRHLHELLKSWLRVTRPQAGREVVVYSQEIDDITSLLEILKIQVEIAVEPSGAAESPSDKSTEVRTSGAERVRRARSSEKSRVHRDAAIELVYRNIPSGIRTVATLQRVLFVVAVWVEAVLLIDERMEFS